MFTVGILLGAIAAEYLSRKDSSIVTIIGAGVQGHNQLIGLCEVRKIKKVFIFDIDQKRCEEYVKEMKKQVEAEIIKGSDIKAAMQESDIIVTATPSFIPVIKGEWLKEVCHVNEIGFHSPDARELDENVIKRASKIVLDTWNAKNVGDIAYSISKWMLKEEGIYGEIGEIVASKKPGRTTEKEITVFKSVGAPITDVATALKVYEPAKEKGIGQYFDILGIS